MGKNAGNCPHLCRKGDGTGPQHHRMQYKKLWQKVTVIPKGREAPYQTAVPRTPGRTSAQSRVADEQNGSIQKKQC